MSKITLNSIASLDAINAVATVNANMVTIQNAFDNNLSRDGTSPNPMGANLDMNSFRLINLPAPASNTDPLRVQDLGSYVVTTANQITVPAVTTVGAIPYYNATNGLTLGTDSLHTWDSVNHRLLLGIGPADAALTINSNTGPSTVAPAVGTYIHIVGADTQEGALTFDAFGNRADFYGRRANTSNSGKTALNSNDQILTLIAQGWDTTQFLTGAQLRFTAAEAWSATNHGAQLSVMTVPTGGSTTLGESLRVNSSGIMVVPATAVPAGGTTGVGVSLSSTSNLGVYFGSGVPTLNAAQGSIYIRTDGSSTSTRLYVNTNGTTGWTNFTSAT